MTEKYNIKFGNTAKRPNYSNNLWLRLASNST